jgi:hypothetical protein
MRKEPFILTQPHVHRARTALKVILGVTCGALVLSGGRYLQAQMVTADLADRVRMQSKTLSDLRRAAVKPTETSPNSSSIREDAIVKVQTALERNARAANCEITEFQASPDRAPYLSSFTLETNHPDWEQVQVHVTLSGTVSAAFATVEGLRKCGVPIEPDSIELARQKFDEHRHSVVTLRLSFRVLTRLGAKT